MELSKQSFQISKSLVWKAYLKVKTNGGAPGIDNQSILDFEKNLEKNLYKIWNRMSSGSYFPVPVKSVSIPKKSGGSRILGIPSVSDRIAQMVVKQVIEPVLEPIFHPDSYGYRPNKSAHDAIAITRERCWRNNWVVEFDIKGCFDNISHSLLNKALARHIKSKWVLLYIKRWLEGPISDLNGNIVTREKGIPQGGVISPVLMNLFLHYVFDAWITVNIEGIPFCRYADDGIAHCKSLKQAEYVMDKLKARFKECGLELHPNKTKIVYCRDNKRTDDYPTKSFDFLGYTFQPRSSVNKDGERFLGFLPGVSRTALKAMRQEVRKSKIQLRNNKSLEDLSKYFKLKLQGWLNYYGRFYASALGTFWEHFNWYLVRWVMRKFKRFKGHQRNAKYWLGKIAKANPYLFPHWRIGFTPTTG